MRGEFRGILIGLKHRGKLYTFATYNRSRTKAISVDSDKIRWTVEGPDGLRLTITAERAEGSLLHAPIRTEMHRRVEETLNARLHVTMRDSDGNVLFEDTGEIAGLEVHGDIARLLTTRGR